MSRNDDQIRTVATALSGMSVVLGTGAVLAPRSTARLFGVPAGQITPSTRLIGRFFGAREVALAALTLAAVQRSPRQPALFAACAGVSGADAAFGLLTLLGRRGTARAAALSVVVGAPAGGHLGMAVRADVVRRGGAAH